MQKLAIDGGMGCPNRDGEVGSGGCTFCRNDAFSPPYCRSTRSITEQIDLSLDFHHRRGRRGDIYLAYFQSGSNSYADIEYLEKVYSEALRHRAIGGIIIGTRSDCISSEKLDLINHISHGKYAAIEYGIESVYDSTLQAINRGHDFRSVELAVEATHAHGIDVGGHLILGLPDESWEDILRGMERVNSLKLDFVKFHQLQIYRSTPIARMWELSPERFLFGRRIEAATYVECIVELLRHLDPKTAVERLVSSSPREFLIHSPLEGVRPDVIRNMVIVLMVGRGFQQGDALR